jgi:hypothetical protein
MDQQDQLPGPSKGFDTASSAVQIGPQQTNQTKESGDHSELIATLLRIAGKLRDLQTVKENIRLATEEKERLRLLSLNEIAKVKRAVKSAKRTYTNKKRKLKRLQEGANRKVII